MIRNRIIYPDYHDGSYFDLARAEGSHLWTRDGRRLIDFTSGWNTTNLGWNHPEVAAAMAQQAARNSFAPMWAADPAQTQYAALLTSALPDPLQAVGKATGGTEANEMALKAARAFTGRRTIIGLHPTYHGQSLATLAIGYPPSAVADVAAPCSEVVQLPFPTARDTDRSPAQVLSDFANRLESALREKTIAAVVTEPGLVTGWGSVAIAPPGYLRTVRQLTQHYGTLLILDEVGTGFSRLGRLFGLELQGVTPDIVTLAKGMSNGAAAIGAMVTRQDIAEAASARGHLFSTFGWTPVACAAATATLTVHRRDRVWEKAEHDGRYILGRLRAGLADHPGVADIRGVGMEIGIELVAETPHPPNANTAPVDRVVQSALKQSLHLVCDHERTIQVMPPLTIARDALDEGLSILIDSVRSLRA